MSRIVTLTMNPAIDRTIMVDHVIPQKKLRTSAPRFEPGGGGVCVARALHRLGGDTLAIFPSGGDAGRLLERLLRDEGVPIHAVPIAGFTRENITVEETATRQEYRFVLPGPRVDPQHAQTCADELFSLAREGEWIVASGSMPTGVPDDFLARLAVEARARGLKFVVDSTAQPLRRAIEAGVWMCKPNLNELIDLAGRPLDQEADQEAVVRNLIERGRAEIVLASLGAGGAFLAWKDGAARLRTPTVSIRSRVGAGDSTVAGMVLRLAEGWPVLEAARYGIAAGAAAVMTHGSELCRRGDTERLYAAMREDGAG
jgi:6-phosphofructokinase 2